MTTYRDMEILFGEAEDYVVKMLQDFELQLQGNRINYIRGDQWPTDISQSAETPGTPFQEPLEQPKEL